MKIEFLFHEVIIHKYVKKELCTDIESSWRGNTFDLYWDNEMGFLCLNYEYNVDRFKASIMSELLIHVLASMYVNGVFKKLKYENYYHIPVDDMMKMIKDKAKTIEK